MSLIERIKNGELDEAELVDCVTSNDLPVAIAAAEAVNATESILEIAALDNDRAVRIAAVMNPNISRETLIKMKNDSDCEIAMLAQQYLERGK